MARKMTHFCIEVKSETEITLGNEPNQLTLHRLLNWFFFFKFKYNTPIVLKYKKKTHFLYPKI